jgi:hypothetical protein
MRALNRSAIVVRPNPPFLDWLNAVDPTSQALTLDSLTREPTIYLVEECDDLTTNGPAGPYCPSSQPSQLFTPRARSS